MGDSSFFIGQGHCETWAHPIQLTGDAFPKSIKSSGTGAVHGFVGFPSISSELHSCCSVESAFCHQFRTQNDDFLLDFAWNFMWDFYIWMKMYNVYNANKVY